MNFQEFVASVSEIRSDLSLSSLLIVHNWMNQDQKLVYDDHNDFVAFINDIHSDPISELEKLFEISLKNHDDIVSLCDEMSVILLGIIDNVVVTLRIRSDW